MPRQTITHPLAIAELQQSIDVYEDRRVGTGEELREHARAIRQQILDQPNRFPKENRNTRRATIIKFHFDVFYRVTKDGEIHIISYYHQSRKPGGWKYRCWS